MKTIYKDLLFCNYEADTFDQVITFLGSKLFEAKKVSSDFVENVLKREYGFPTGLPTKPYGVAIPHTEQEYVYDSCLSFCTLKHPVMFKSILGDGSDIPVKFVFLLASKDSEGHMSFMKNIMTAFQSSDIQKDLAEARSNEDLYKTLAFIDNVG